MKEITIQGDTYQYTRIERDEHSTFLFTPDGVIEVVQYNMELYVKVQQNGTIYRDPIN